jgi:hypothetical protein
MLTASCKWRQDLGRELVDSLRRSDRRMSLGTQAACSRFGVRRHVSPAVISAMAWLHASERIGYLHK